MKHLKTFENHIPEHISDSVTAEDVIQMYIEKYPEYSEFFTEFIDVYPDYSSFKESILGECENEYESDEDSDEYEEGSDGLTDDEIIDMYWYPELEVHVLQTDLNCDYPGDEIWPEFHTDLVNSEWGKK